MNRQKRHANTPPKGNEEKKIDKNPTPEALQEPQGASGGFDSASLPLTTSRSSTKSTTSQSTTVSRVSARLRMPKDRDLDENILNGVKGVFYGGKRDVIEVAILNVDGQPYTTNIKSSDAIRDIFIGALDMDKNDLIGIQIAWKGKPLISFRIKNKIDIDLLPAKFSFDKEYCLDNGETIIKTFNCAIKGVRPRTQTTVDDGTRKVTFKKCGWKLTHPQVERWASYYGIVMSPVTEAVRDDLDPDVQPEFNTVGNGDLQITVRLKRPIPQFLPMFGYKVRVFYKDIPRMCTNCFVTGHLKKDCPNQTKNWLHYVTNFISDNDHISEDDFGFWMKKSREFVRDNPDIFEYTDSINPSETDIGDLNIDSDSEQENDQQVTLTSSPKIITENPITSVSNFVDSIETQAKDSKETQPTGEKPKRGRSKGSTDTSKNKKLQ